MTSSESGSGNRAAHASIAGYYAQIVRAAVEWSRLGADERLVIEGDEDFDREMLNNGDVVATTLVQHKTSARRVGWDADVQRSVLGFVASFARHHRSNRTCTPLYISTSDAAAVEVIEQWSKYTTLSALRRSTLAKKIRADLEAHAQLKPDKQSVFAIEAREGVTYLSETQERWDEFVAATRWEFGAASDVDNTTRLKEVLGARADTRGLSIEDLALRIVYEVLTCAKDPSRQTRSLVARDLARLIDQAKAQLQSWADGPEAAIFFETLDLNRLLDDSADRIKFEHRRGSIDQQGGPRLLRSVVREELSENRETLLVTGERGTGKTSAVAEWALEEQDAGRAVVWITCREKGDDVASFLRAKGVRNGSKFLTTLSRRNIALVLDALDQGRNPTTLTALAELVERASTAGVRTVALVRRQHLDSMPSIATLSERFSTSHVEPFNDQELEILLGGASTPPAFVRLWQSLNPQMKMLARFPLHTHFLWKISLNLAEGVPKSIGTLAELFDLYWRVVVQIDGEGIDADAPLAEAVRRMLNDQRMATAIEGISGVERLRDLVRAYVLTHPRVPRFGINDGEVSFAFDAVFDYAVFRLLWRNASVSAICASLTSCGAFAAALAPSFRFALEFRGVAQGPRAAVELAGAIYGESSIDNAARETFAREFARWVDQDATHRSALIKFRKTGTQDISALFTKVLVSRGAAS